MQDKALKYLLFVVDDDISARMIAAFQFKAPDYEVAAAKCTFADTC